jgi:hypothetical protein
MNSVIARPVNDETMKNTQPAGMIVSLAAENSGRG